MGHHLDLRLYGPPKPTRQRDAHAAGPADRNSASRVSSFRLPRLIANSSLRCGRGGVVAGRDGGEKMTTGVPRRAGYRLAKILHGVVGHLVSSAGLVAKLGADHPRQRVAIRLCATRQISVPIMVLAPGRSRPLRGWFHSR